MILETEENQPLEPPRPEQCWLLIVPLRQLEQDYWLRLELRVQLMILETEENRPLGRYWRPLSREPPRLVPLRQLELRVQLMILERQQN
jgi:hypothetical protein